MRKTRQELLSQYSFWNETGHDIVQVKYGDIPLTRWDSKEYDWWKTLSGTLSNILGVDAYVYTQNGPYDIYETLIGKIYIADDGKVLCGDVDVKYRGSTYNVYVNKMYGLNALSVHCIMSEYYVGFSNINGLSSSTTKRHTKEMEKEVIDKVLNKRLEDYGPSVQKFMSAARELYMRDPKNYIMEKTFELAR